MTRWWTDFVTGDKGDKGSWKEQVKQRYHVTRVKVSIVLHHLYKGIQTFRRSSQKWDLVCSTSCHYLLLWRYAVAQWISPFALYEKDKTFITLRYMEGGQEYRVQWKRPPKGPRHAVFLYDAHGNNVTNQLRPYLGPHYDFHLVPVTPLMLGYPEIHVQYGDHPIQRYTLHERIHLGSSEKE